MAGGAGSGRTRGRILGDRAVPCKAASTGARRGVSGSFGAGPRIGTTDPFPPARIRRTLRAACSLAKPPQSLARFDILQRLGAGGVGEVFLARSRAGKLVAIKTIADARRDGHEGETADAFAREASVCVRLRHPCIVQVRAFLEEPGFAALVFEYVPGRRARRACCASASRAACACPTWPPGTSSSACSRRSPTPTASATRAAVETPIVHRDVSPSNVLLDWSGGVKIADFGIAKVLGVSPGTRVGIVKGTLGCMAPEQARGEPVDERADVYAAALLAWRLATGRVPFGRHQKDEYELLRAMRNPRIPPLASLRPDLPEPLLDAVARALEPERERRTITAARAGATPCARTSTWARAGRELASLLERWKGALERTVKRAAPQAPRRSRPSRPAAAPRTRCATRRWRSRSTTSRPPTARRSRRTPCRAIPPSSPRCRSRRTNPSRSPVPPAASVSRSAPPAPAAPVDTVRPPRSAASAPTDHAARGGHRVRGRRPRRRAARHVRSLTRRDPQGAGRASVERMTAGMPRRACARRSLRASASLGRHSAFATLRGRARGNFVARRTSQPTGRMSTQRHGDRADSPARDARPSGGSGSAARCMWVRRRCVARCVVAIVDVALRKLGLVGETAGARRPRARRRPASSPAASSRGSWRLPERAGARALDRFHGLHDRLASALAFDAGPRPSARRSWTRRSRTPCSRVVAGEAARRGAHRRAAARSAPRRGLAGVLGGVLLFEVRHHVPVAAREDDRPDRDGARRPRRREGLPRSSCSRRTRATTRRRRSRSSTSSSTTSPTSASTAPRPSGAWRRSSRSFSTGSEADKKALEDAAREDRRGDEEGGAHQARRRGARPTTSSTQARDALHDLAKKMREQGGADRQGQAREDARGAEEGRRRRRASASRRSSSAARSSPTRSSSASRRQADGGRDDEEQSLLQKKERELERLDRDLDAAEERRAASSTASTASSQQAAEDLMKDLGLSGARTSTRAPRTSTGCSSRR